MCALEFLGTQGSFYKFVSIVLNLFSLAVILNRITNNGGIYVLTFVGRLFLMS